MAAGAAAPALGLGDDATPPDEMQEQEKNDEEIFEDIQALRATLPSFQWYEESATRAPREGSPPPQPQAPSDGQAQQASVAEWNDEQQHNLAALMRTCAACEKASTGPRQLDMQEDIDWYRLVSQSGADASKRASDMDGLLQKERIKIQMEHNNRGSMQHRQGRRDPQ